MGEKLMSESNYDSNAFSEGELKVKDFVIDYFKDFNCRKITEYSHDEKPYKEIDENEKISYELSSGLSLNLT